MKTRTEDLSAAGLRASAPGAARVGIGGPVGSGKTALLEQLIPRFRQRGTSIAVITNDLVTREDAERVRRSGLIDPERVWKVEPARIASRSQNSAFVGRELRGRARLTWVGGRLVHDLDGERP